MFFKIQLLAVYFLFSLNLFAQNKEDKYIKKNGLQKITIFSKRDTIPFLITDYDIKKPKPIILFLQGSLAKPVIFKDSTGASVSAFPFYLDDYLAKFNFVIIPRYGVPIVGSYEKDTEGYLDINGKVPAGFIKNDNLKYRTFQAKTVLDYLYKQKWVRKDSIFVIGHSEGYRVAAKFSENNKKIAKLVCMSANPFNRIAEYIMRSRIETLSATSDSLIQKDIDDDVDSFKNIPDNIEEYRDDKDLYNRMSYNSELSYESLLKFPNPILVTYGTEDFGSLHNDLLPFLLRRKKLKLVAYPDLNHNYYKKAFDKEGKEIEGRDCWDAVFKDVQNWLLKK